MRGIQYKYAVALNLSIVSNNNDAVYEAIEQAKTISIELGMQICLTNPFNDKFVIFNSYDDTNEIFNKLK